MLKADGSYLKGLNRIEKQDLLILDDFGLQPLDAQARMALLEIIEDRHGSRESTIIASQLPVENWHETIGDGSVADAILDRIVHKAHRIQLSGQSLRKINNLVQKTGHNDGSKRLPRKGWSTSPEST